MASITTINGSGVVGTDRTTINTNFANLNSDKIETSYLDTDTTLSANSDSKIATQKATKAYVDASVNPTGRSWNEYAADAGATDAYAITLSGLSAYATGMTFKFKANTANTGACTLNVNGLGAKTIKKDVSSDLSTGDILANQIVEIIYDGTNMQMVSRTGTPSTPAINYKAGSATRDLSTASGTQTIAHGLGVIPTMVKMTFVASDSASTSFASTVYTNSTQYSLYTFTATGSGTEESAGAILRIYQDVAGNKYNTGVVTVDATNISIAWTLTGTVAATTAYITWEAQY